MTASLARLDKVIADVDKTLDKIKQVPDVKVKFMGKDVSKVVNNFLDLLHKIKEALGGSSRAADKGKTLQNQFKILQDSLKSERTSLSQNKDKLEYVRADLMMEVLVFDKTQEVLQILKALRKDMSVKEQARFENFDKDLEALQKECETFIKIDERALSGMERKEEAEEFDDLWTKLEKERNFAKGVKPQKQPSKEKEFISKHRLFDAEEKEMTPEERKLYSELAKKRTEVKGVKEAIGEEESAKQVGKRVRKEFIGHQRLPKEKEIKPEKRDLATQRADNVEREKARLERNVIRNDFVEIRKKLTSIKKADELVNLDMMLIQIVHDTKTTLKEHIRKAKEEITRLYGNNLPKDLFQEVDTHITEGKI